MCDPPQDKFAHGCVMILVSKASGKTLRSFHGVAQGIGGRGAHGMSVFLDVIWSSMFTLYSLFPTVVAFSQLSGRFIYAGLESLPYRTRTHLNIG